MVKRQNHAAGERFASRRAMSILVALIVVSTLIMLASVGLKISSDEADVTSYDLYSMQSYYSAESGLMHAAAALNADNQLEGKIRGTLEVSLEEKSPGDERGYSFYEAEIKLDRSKETGTIISTGEYMGVKRRLAAEIKTLSPLKLKKARELYD
ncbi:MAG TPA: hypothetical protein PKW98_04475 [Candidatus Wallbacteria bacterium]|nr:hypothetical protein [Candidatus Wallbacteria bacterium]HPG57049.1 hypothetical protein [Candidatus Wallbacteria bacterium]